MGGRSTFGTYGFRLFAIGVTCCLALAAVAHLYLFGASEDAVDRSMRYDLAWTGSNGRIEVAHLERHLARYVAFGAKGDEEAVRLFYDILLSRMETWSSGGFREFLALSPRRLERFEKIRARVDGLKADIERLSQPEAQWRLFETLSEIGPQIDRIGADAYTTSVTDSAAIRDAIQHHQRLQRWLVMGLLISGALVLAVTALQNRFLRAAHTAAARHAEDSLFLARHDALTKLPNRSAFEAAYQAACQARRPDERLLIAAVDLDGFKSINDLLGHPAGDAVLVAVSELLTGEAARADPRNIVCRVGGDEFLALLWTPNDAASTMAFARSILAALEHPLETAYGAMMIGASVGVAVSDISGIDDLIVNADLALTEAKARGKGIALAFEPDMLAGLKRRLHLEAGLGAAIARGDFLPYYQPKVDLASGRLVGVEALTRWRHPELGWVYPGEFIPIAESSGAIVKIGRLVLEAACRDAAAMPPDIGVAVNISVVQILRDDIVGAVKDVLAGTGLSPPRLILEVTESVMMTDPEKVLEALNHLKALGVRISLDDFGTGYSALAYLTQFAWDELKIDRSFIGRAWCDPINLTIIKAVKMLAEQMHAKLTIEGVETPEQRDLLREICCDTAQGYLFGRPMPLADLQPMLLRHVAAALAASEAGSSAQGQQPRAAIAVE